LAAMQTLRIKATQPQARFLASQAKYPLFCGGFGSGKSEAMANRAMMDAAEASDAMIGLYAPTYDLVRLITAARMQQKLSEHGIRYNYNQSENVIYTSNTQFGDFILRTLDNPARIVGYQTYRSHVDELDTLRPNHARTVWNQILARTRQVPKGMTPETVFNRVSAYTTPEGFKFCHDRWVKNASDLYQIVKASTYSNPYLPKDYIESLKASYPAQLIAAYIEGEFVNLTSGAVYPDFDRRQNACYTTATATEQIHVGMDFNVNNMSAAVVVIRDGEPHFVNELTGIRDTPAMIEAVAELYGKDRVTIYPDASGRNASSKGASLTDIALLRAHFTVYAKKQNPRIKDRVLAVNVKISKRELRVNVDHCPELANGLEQQAYDKNGMPDKTAGVDHVLDAAGYVIHWLFPIERPSSGIIETIGV
jgi:hypothetical protein